MDNKLPASFYQGEDVVAIARNLLGKQLNTQFNNVHTAGIIVEAEAYCGATDRACHAFGPKRTPRTEVMFAGGGVAYVYLVYGLHHLFNIVTNRQGVADAVLIRAIEPTIGSEIMQGRRGIMANGKLLTGGPARLTQAMGITVAANRTNLTGDKIWLSDGRPCPDDEIVATTRIGVDYAGADALLPWRFYLRGNKYVSKEKLR